MSKMIDLKKIEPYLHREDWGTPDEKWLPESDVGKMLDFFAEKETLKNKIAEKIASFADFLDGGARPDRVTIDIYYSAVRATLKLNEEDLDEIFSKEEAI